MDYLPQWIVLPNFLCYETGPAKLVLSYRKQWPLSAGMLTLQTSLAEVF